MYNNLCYNSNFIFSNTSSGVAVYGLDFGPLGVINTTSVNCIYATEDSLYLATTNSGILYLPVASIYDGVFNDLLIYKQFPDVLSNNIHYIHGSENYLLVTSDQGIEQFDLVNYTRIYNESSKDASICFQTSSGGFYYVTSEVLDVFYNFGAYKIIISLTGSTSIANYQLKIVLTSDIFDYSNFSGVLSFFDQNQQELPYYVEEWALGGTSTIWVKIIDIGTEYLYMVYGNSIILPKNDPVSVFDLYDNFDYPLAVLGTNIFLPSYGNITVSGSIHPEYLYDGSTTIYYSYGYPIPGDYFQIEFFIPRIIRQCRLWQSNYSLTNNIYIYASNSGTFTGEEVLLFSKTDSLSAYEVMTFTTSDPYTYYRIVRGDGTSAWQLTEARLFEMTYEPVTTISGSPWVYSTDPYKFIMLSSSVLTCNSSYNDYIRTDYNLTPPLVIEQRVKLSSGAVGKIAYSSMLEPFLDGISWYPVGSPTFAITMNDKITGTMYEPLVAINTTWSVLGIYIIPGIIKIMLEGTNIDTFSTYWVGGTSMTTNRAMRIFGADHESSVDIDWVRVRKYSLTGPEVKELSPAIPIVPKYALNAVYDNTVNWSDSSVGCFYDILEEKIINDIFITEGTSTYSSSDNVIFIATSDGLIVLEERRGDENNSRVKYIKAKGDI